MAQFTGAQGRVKSLFFSGTGDEVSLGLDSKDPFHQSNLRSIQPLLSHRFPRIYSSVNNSGTHFTSDPRWHVGDDDETVYQLHHDDDDDDSDYDVDDDDDADDNEFSCFRGLVLDISYRPINVVCWKRAICLEFMEKADVLEYYDQTVNSPSGSFYIPAVLRVPHLLQVVQRRRIKSNLSRKNILYRDGYTCQYCSSRENLTIDHVIPIARGGLWTWENLVTACAKCNSRKGQKTPEEAHMKLIKVPKAPKDFDILAIPLTTAAIKMLKTRYGTPQEWRQYLP